MAENILAVETHDRLIPNINGRTSSQDWSSNTLAEIRKYTKQELLSFFKPIDALPDGFTQWDAIVSIACLEPENKAYPSFEIDKDNVRLGYPPQLFTIFRASTLNTNHVLLECEDYPQGKGEEEEERVERVEPAQEVVAARVCFQF